MSGGHFDYKQHQITEIADQIERMIINNNKKDEYGYANNFDDETLNHLQQAVKTLKIAQVYAQRIDWLVCGDDSEKTFKKRLTKEIAEINEQLKEKED